MNKEEILSIWAPGESPWSRWAKPVLFAYLDTASLQLSSALAPANADWAPPPSERAALVLDLPSAEGIAAGVALAGAGYRPVPLYNAVPLPSGPPQADNPVEQAVAAVDVWPIMSALRTGAEQLAQLKLPAEAPPAFLLDANRRGDGQAVKPGAFDNRSVSFTTDFPSANFLSSQGIKRVILAQKDALEPQTDLAHSLRRWQDGGLALERLRLDAPSRPEPFAIARPSWYGAMFQRALAGLGLRRSPRGGFGAWVLESSAGG